MSAVLCREKQLYQTALMLEVLILFVISGFVWWFGKWHFSLSFATGMLCTLLPQVLFVYWIFFRHFAKNLTKMTTFYRAEGIKWIATIALLIVVLVLLPNLSHGVFFIGYVAGLVLNIVVPIYLKYRVD